MTQHWTLILASQSPARRMMLENAGLTVKTEPAAIDEEAISDSLAAGGASPRDIAAALAETKTARIAARHDDPKTLVIGADQVLSLDGKVFHKPPTHDAALAQLQALQGRTHRLHSAACLGRSGSVVWRHVDEADLTMRPLSDAFIGAYLDEVGVTATQSVGAYQIEGQGVQLFSRIAGSHFTILGLPLLPLLEALRIQGALGT